MTESHAQDLALIAGQLPLILVAFGIVVWAAVGQGIPPIARVLAAISAPAFAVASLVPNLVIAAVDIADAQQGFWDSGVWTPMTVILNIIRALAVVGAGVAIAWRRG